MLAVLARHREGHPALRPKQPLSFGVCTKCHNHRVVMNIDFGTGCKCGISSAKPCLSCFQWEGVGQSVTHAATDLLYVTHYPRFTAK